MAASIDLAEERHVPGMLAIYAPLIESTAISFELAVPGPDEFQARVRRVLERYAWLVCEDGGEVLGYAYAGPFRDRPAYGWSVETTVYVGAAHRRRGIARALYTSLFALLRPQGFHAAVAGITLPNEGSVRLHESFGFEPVGTFARVGFKRGAWHDVGFWQLALAPPPDEPAPPRPLDTIRGTPLWDEALASGVALVR